MARTFGDILKGRTAETFDDILKFNPYHDRLGRFSSAGGAASFTYALGKSKAHDFAIAREKERTASIGGSPEENRKQAIKQIEDKIRKQDFESAACIDSNGKTLFFKNGEERQVEFDSNETAQMKGATLTHNHPDSSHFSNPDIHTFVVTEMQEIRVACRNGNNFSLRRTGEKDYQQEYKFIDAFYKQKAKSKNAELKIDRENDVVGKIRRGEMSAKDANDSINKRISKRMDKYLNKYAKNYGFEYTMEGSLNE